MTEKEHNEFLIGRAREARENAFCPYSDYAVGAVLETDEGLFTGCNIEVSGDLSSTHAEMLACYKAVEAGAREFHVLAVSAQAQHGDVAICGHCQHTLAQFTDELLVLEDGGDWIGEFRLQELIGDAYQPSTRDRS